MGWAHGIGGGSQVVLSESVVLCCWRPPTHPSAPSIGHVAYLGFSIFFYEVGLTTIISVVVRVK